MTHQQHDSHTNDSEQESGQLVDDWCEKTSEQVDGIAGIFLTKLSELELTQPISPLQGVVRSDHFPFETPVIPAAGAVLEKIFPGYIEPTKEEIAVQKAYADAPENYGTAPGEGAAFVTSLVRALQPETAFVFGTARGRMEYLIGSACESTEIATIDIPDELLSYGLGKPNSNNIRYREKIGVTDNSKIGDIFKNDPALNSRVHQLLGDSFTFSAELLAGTMRLVVVDGNHHMPNSLKDMATALELIHEQGGVIVVDDFRKGSPLNSGVDAAVATFCQVTQLPALMPMPKPGEEGLFANVAVIVVPANYESAAERALVLSNMADELCSYENLPDV